MSALGIRGIAAVCVGMGLFIDLANGPNDVMEASQFVIVACLLLILAEMRA